MGRFIYFLYNISLPVAILIAKLYSRFNKKIEEGVAGRKGFKERWIENTQNMDRNKPVIWFHVASAGELEQALPVINGLTKRLDGNVSIALTFFSPSGLNFLKRIQSGRISDRISLIDYMPFDTRDNMSFCLETLKPDAIVYTKYDVWPNLATEGSKRGIPQILISATIAENSKMLIAPARSFYSRIYSNLSAIAAIGEADIERLRTLIREDIEIAKVGDTRFDRVHERAKNRSFSPPPSLLKSKRNIIVAGSTWPPDEEVVIGGFASSRQSLNNPILLIVPHEPSKKRVSQIERHLSRYGLTHLLYSEAESSGEIDSDCIIVNKVGFLAELYSLGKVAYVGGAFTTGVHSVLEPAVMGIPIIFGPKYKNSHEARDLMEIGAAKAVKSKNDFAHELTSLITDEKKRNEAGKKARAYIEENIGATEKCVELVLNYIEQKKSTQKHAEKINPSSK